MKIMKLRISDRLYKSRHRALTCNGKTIHVFVTLFLVFSIICVEISVLTPQNVCVCVFVLYDEPKIIGYIKYIQTIHMKIIIVYSYYVLHYVVLDIKII